MSHPARFDLDRFHALELQGEAQDRIERHLGECDDCQHYITALETERRELLERRSGRQFAAQITQAIDRKAEKSPGIRWASILVPAAVGVGAVALLLVLLSVPFGPQTSSPSPSQLGENMRWMGDGAATKVYLKRDAEVFQYRSQALQSGDQLRFEIVIPPGNQGHAALIAVEGARVIPLVPARFSEAPIPVRRTTLLPGSITVEPGEEPTRILLVVRQKAFSLTQLKSEVERAIPPNGDHLPVDGLVRVVEIDLE